MPAERRPGSSRLPAQRGAPGPLAALLRELAFAAGLVGAGASVLYVAVLLPSRVKTERLRAQRDALALEKTKLEGEVAALRAETRALESEPWVVERALRRRLGFLRAGERVLKLGRE